jgi:hypothetical protein
MKGAYTRGSRTTSVLFACGRVVHGAGAGNLYGGAVEGALKGALPWIIEGDPRWEER